MDRRELFAPYADAAAELLLEAIAEAGEDRAAVAQAVLTAEVPGGVLGSYESRLTAIQLWVR